MGNCHLPLQGLNNLLLQLLISNTPWKEFRVDSRNEAGYALGKTGRTGLQIDIFRSQFYEPHSCVFSYLEKHSNGDNCSWLAETFCKKKKKICACFHISPSAKSHIYWPSPYLFGIVSQGYLRYCLPGYSPHILPQIKLPSQLSHSVLLFKLAAETPISASYLTSNQSDDCAWADHAPCDPLPQFQKPVPESHWRVQVVWARHLAPYN